jgi:choline kinase
MIMADPKTPVRKAVILAAGLGNRLRRLGTGTPKPFVPIDKDDKEFTFIDLHIHNLTTIGVREIFLVGNQVTYGREFNHDPEVSVQWILNPTDDLASSGSADSARHAWHSRFDILDGTSRVILMDADIAYTHHVMQLLADAPGPHSKTLVCRKTRNDNEEVLVFAKEGIPRIHGKGLLGTPMTADLECLGEATGILLLEPKDHELVKAANDWLINYSSAKTRVEHEDVTQVLMNKELVRAVTFDDEHLFMECDTPEEYELLLNEVFPKIKRSLF